MALKDWKKESKNVWSKRYNESSGSHNFTIVEIQNKEVVVSTEGNINKILFIKKFKSKSQALKFAKQYMRTH